MQFSPPCSPKTLRSYEKRPTTFFVNYPDKKKVYIHKVAWFVYMIAVW